MPHNANPVRPNEGLLAYNQALGALVTHISRNKEGDRVALWIDKQLWLFSMTLPEAAGIALDKEMKLQRHDPVIVFDPKHGGLTSILGNDESVSYLKHLVRVSYEIGDRGHRTDEIYEDLIAAFGDPAYKVIEAGWMAAYKPGVWMFSTALSEGFSNALKIEMQNRPLSAVFTPTKELTMVLASEGLRASLTGLIRQNA
jgi:hypothetical protein